MNGTEKSTIFFRSSVIVISHTARSATCGHCRILLSFKLFFYLIISQKYQYYPVSILVVFLLHNSIISLNVSTKVEWLLSQYIITDLFSILLFSILGFKQGFGWIGNGKHNQLDPFEVNFTCVSQFCFRTSQFYF